jgi:transposase
MHATTVGVDLAKNRFELAVSDEHSGIQRRERLTRARFEQFFANFPPSLVVMEACGSAHYWARSLQAKGHEVRLLPAQYVRAYVRRNKTDAADAAALIQAARCAEIRPVPIKSVDQQVLQQLHRVRQQLLRTRTARMNLIRGSLREFGICIPLGITRGLRAVREALEIADSGLPEALRPLILETLQEISALKGRAEQIEHTLQELTREDPIVHQLMNIPGVGLLNATALRAAVADIQRFPSGRHLASWLGITAREHSSAERRRLGSISKQGDVYLRTLLVHGARAALLAARRAAQAGRPLDRLRSWVLETERRCGRNKATVALANKLARIIWATWNHQRAFDSNWSARPHLMQRQAAA